MLVRDVNPYPIQLLVNYWEVKPSLFGSKLDELLRQGVTHVASFIPWQALESDISHSLTKYLQALSDRKMKVSLILTPEVGVYYPNSGLPKDLVSEPGNLAQNVFGTSFATHLPPHSFCLPSLFSPTFLKRYHNYLARIDSLLSDYAKNQPRLLEGVKIVLTGSYWKYNRHPKEAFPQIFQARVGDFSNHALVAFREHLDLFYSQKEFLDNSQTSNQRWKTKSLDTINFDLFLQQAEQVFRIRSAQSLKRKALPVRVNQVELFTPEADPGFAYAHFFQMLTGSKGDFKLFSAAVTQMALRKTKVGECDVPSFVHWSGLGGFRTLSDSEKQFLILKSLLLMGGMGGGLLVDEQEWFALSPAFRLRAENLSKMISGGQLSLKTRVLYLTPNLWSVSNVLFSELTQTLNTEVRVISQLDALKNFPECTLLMVDPNMIFTHKTLETLIDWAQSGRILVLPKSPLYSTQARENLESTLSQGRQIEFNLGLNYSLHFQKEGKIIVYDFPEGAMTQRESLKAYKNFVSSLLSLADLKSYCHLGDGRLEVISLRYGEGAMGLFILNDHPKSLDTHLLFQREVSISDFSSRTRLSDSTPRFEFSIPSCGVLPILVEGLEHLEEERSYAAQSADLLKKHPDSLAKNEFPGYLQKEGEAHSPWN